MDPITTLSQLDPMSVKYLMQPSVITAQAGSDASFFGTIISVIVIFVIIVFLANIFEERKSTKYRKVLVDMYVSGTVRKLATEEGIDIEEEYKSFKKFEKKSKRDYKELDAVIEDNLKEKSQEKTDKDIEKLNSTSNKKV